MEHDTKNSVFALQGWNMTPNVYQLIAMQGRNKIHKVYQIIVRKEDDNIKCFFYKGLGAIRAKIGPISDVDKIFSKMYSQYVLFINKYN
jgi:hypothetical protein